MASLRTVHSKLKHALEILNKSSRATLLELPGLGPKRVDAILQAKTQHQEEQRGRSLRLKDVVEIPGVGPSLLVKLSGDAQAAHLVKFITFYQDRFTQDHTLISPSTVLSIDFGIANFAYTLVDDSYRVRQWSKVSLDLPKPYSPREYYHKVKSGVEELPSADMYILEEQSHRNPGNQGFLGISMELRVLEAVIFTLLHQRSNPQVHSVLAKRVAAYFGISASKSSVKKKAGVGLVKELLDSNGNRTTPMGNRVIAPDTLVKYYLSEKKKDDLSDSLLQALALLDWNQMAREM